MSKFNYKLFTKANINGINLNHKLIFKHYDFDLFIS